MNLHLPTGQSIGTTVLLARHVFWDPASVYQNRACAIRSVEGRDDLEAVLAFVDSWAEKHLSAVAVPAYGCDAAVIKVFESVEVDFWREGERRTDEAVFVAGNEVGFPFETVDLP